MSDTELALGAFLPDMGAMCWREDVARTGSLRAVALACVGIVVVVIAAVVYAAVKL